MAELTMFMSTDLSRPVPPVICATDARGAEDGSHGAYGMVAADADTSRVKLLLEKGLRPGHTITRFTGEYTGRRRPEEPWRRQVPLTMAEAAFADIAKQVLDITQDLYDTGAECARLSLLRCCTVKRSSAHP